MNERFLSRGKRKDNGEWETGFLVITRYDCSDEQYFITDKMTGYHTPVIPETVGQYTGLEDKNGKMIFEGDIVLQPVRETRKHSPCIIEFHKGAFMAHYKSEDWFFDRYYNINSFTKIIGNIHDNPELLEVQDSDR